MTVSPFFYQYLKLVHSKYDKNDHINGFSLHGHTIRHSDGAIMQDIPFKHYVFLYPTLGSWGFSPSNPKWFKFVDWFKNALKDKSFNPIVPGNIASVWYQSFRQQGKGDSMWTIWHIYYAWKHNELTLYPNFPGHKGFTFNWKENGLHFKGSSIKEPNADFDGLVQTLNLSYERLPDEPIVVRNDGTTQ